MKEKTQADRNPDEGACVSVEVCRLNLCVRLYFTLWPDDVVWANLPE